MKYVFLVEERSMKVFLDVLLDKYSDIIFQVVSHSGKSDLKSSIPRKLKALNGIETMFVVLVDKDYSDCKKLKEEFVSICESVAHVNFKVRIVCHELESWYLGDLSAVDKAFGTKLSKERNKTRYRKPDERAHPKEYLLKRINTRGQTDIARKMANAMTPESISENRSHSFHVLLDTLGLCFKQVE